VFRIYGKNNTQGQPVRYGDTIYLQYVRDGTWFGCDNGNCAKGPKCPSSNRDGTTCYGEIFKIISGTPSGKIRRPVMKSDQIYLKYSRNGSWVGCGQRYGGGCGIGPLNRLNSVFTIFGKEDAVLSQYNKHVNRDITPGRGDIRNMRNKSANQCATLCIKNQSAKVL